MMIGSKIEQKRHAGPKTKGHDNVEWRTEENLREEGENSSGTMKFRCGWRGSLLVRDQGKEGWEDKCLGSTGRAGNKKREEKKKDILIINNKLEMGVK